MAALLDNTTRRQRRSHDILPVRDHEAECLQVNEAIADFYHTAFPLAGYIANAHVGPAELAHPARMEPLQRWIIFFRDKQDDMVERYRTGRGNYLFFPRGGIEPAEHERIIHRTAAIVDQIGNQTEVSRR